MATKKTKSNVARSAKKQSFKFKWWMAVIGIVLIALIGVFTIYRSFAAVPITQPGKVQYWRCYVQGRGQDVYDIHELFARQSSGQTCVDGAKASF